MSKNRSGNKNTGPDHNRYKHGMAGTPTYRTWANMKERCNRPDNKNYENYGGRGISYDPRWESFSEFFSDMGTRPDGLTLERIDVNGPYTKDNCKWDDKTAQSRNRRYCKLNMNLADQIRQDRDNGETLWALANKYDVSLSHVHRVCNFQSWNK